MYCHQCGTALPGGTKFCTSCGTSLETKAVEASIPPKPIIKAGFSDKINDPSFKKYLKNSNRWAGIFGVGLALIAVVGFTIAGQMGLDNLDNPQAFYQGLAVGGMFLLITFYTIISRKRSRTWDGTIVDKKVTKKRKKRNRGGDGDDYYYEDYLEYKVVVKGDNGKSHDITAENDDTQYNYYQIGDRVRRHGGLNGYEKYDKSKDEIVFCVACGTLNNIEEEVCFRCKCPLLK